ncbi:uncharacterized protein [Macrobrachium rosenbergii]|uniref:uncharacterized protein n=1 Tax=Macrobrachium rosenbergii TaxID=79674 RepID=UPI0034D4CA8E
MQPHRLGVMNNIRHGVAFLLGQDLLWGCPSPMLLCCLATSTREATPKPPDRDTFTATGMPPSALPSTHQDVRRKEHSPCNSRPRPRSSQKDSHPKLPCSPRREIARYCCKACNVTGHSANWARCPSKQNVADTTPRTIPRGSALYLRQESLSPITSGTPRGFAPPGPSSAMPDSNSLTVLFESTEQCQTSSVSDVAPLLTLISVPGPKLVPVLDPNHVTDPPTGGPPNLTELIITNCEPVTPDISSSQPLSSAKDEPLVDLKVTPSLVHQELSGRDTDDIGSTPTTVVTAVEVGSRPTATRATSNPAPDGTSGLSPESMPSSPPRNGVARPWRNPKKKKKKSRTDPINP